MQAPLSKPGGPPCCPLSFLTLASLCYHLYSFVSFFPFSPSPPWSPSTSSLRTAAASTVAFSPPSSPPIFFLFLLFFAKQRSCCWDAKTGKQHYRERLEAGVGFTASGIAADGKLYYPSEEGDVYVVQAGKEYKLLATNSLGETCLAAPAASAGMLFFRTRGHLVAVANE